MYAAHGLAVDLGMDLNPSQFKGSSRAIAAGRGYIEGMKEMAQEVPNGYGRAVVPNPGALSYETPYPGSNDANDAVDYGPWGGPKTRNVHPRSLGARQRNVVPEHVERHFENMIAGRQANRRSNTQVQEHSQDPIKVIDYNNQGLEVANGNHRLVAAKLAGLQSVPVKVIESRKTHVKEAR